VIYRDASHREGGFSDFAWPMARSFKEWVAVVRPAVRAVDHPKQIPIAELSIPHPLAHRFTNQLYIKPRETTIPRGSPSPFSAIALLSTQAMRRISSLLLCVALAFAADSAYWDFKLTSDASQRYLVNAQMVSICTLTAPPPPDPTSLGHWFRFTILQFRPYDQQPVRKRRWCGL